jgi:hypothetical protein
MTTHNTPAEVPLEESQQVELMQDMLLVQEQQGFGKDFKLSLIRPDCYNPLSIALFFEEKGYIRLLVTFLDYPAMHHPIIEPRGDEESHLFSLAVSQQLRASGVQPVRLQDVIAVAQEVRQGSKKDEKTHEEPKEQDGGRSLEKKKVPSVFVIALLVLALIHLIAQLIIGASVGMVKFIYVKIRIFRRRKMVVAPAKQEAFAPPLKEGINSVPMKRKEEAILPDEEANKGENSEVLPGDNYESPRSLEQAKKKREHALLSIPVIQITLPRTILRSILHNFSQYAPNEYAFLCSGVLTSDGAASIQSYYIGEMQISTPVYCELKEEFTRRILYEEVPRSHNLIVWGHVHPISGPSHTDAESFDYLAACDREIAEQGIIAIHSVAMLVDAHDHRVSFYDTHTHKRISYMLLPEGSASESNVSKMRKADKHHER